MSSLFGFSDSVMALSVFRVVAVNALDLDEVIAVLLIALVLLEGM